MRDAQKVETSQIRDEREMETIKPCAEQFKVVLKTSLEFLLAQSIAVQDY